MNKAWMKKLKLLALLLGAVTVTACSGNTDDKPAYVERPVHELYNQATNALEKRNFEVAAKLFDEVERQHPYSLWATKAQLMAGYAFYEANLYDDALVAINRFIQLHPGNKDIPYAYYLRALSYYEQISDVSRDQGITRNALASLQDIVRRFPNSKYSRDARLKLDLTRDHLAGKEMAVGRWYLRQREYLAAINRFRQVVDNYQTTSHIPEALHRLSEAYSALGLTGEARQVASVLGHNYPGSEWYTDSYALVTNTDKSKILKENAEKNPKNDKGFFAKTWDRIF
jgi:outer membrane protein assembly factor BamD